ncbi:MAG TPA: hypothetical protein PK959_14640 [Candidatus Competibacteraceae bacterium]|nr:hypothetical protein [Candidatus Competibacteraceae bacterium]
MPPNFGAVVLVPFPFTDQSGVKKRPAVIVSSNLYHAGRRDFPISFCVFPSDSTREIIFIQHVGIILASHNSIRTSFVRGHSPGELRST